MLGWSHCHFAFTAACFIALSGCGGESVTRDMNSNVAETEAKEAYVVSETLDNSPDPAAEPNYAPRTSELAPIFVVPTDSNQVPPPQEKRALEVGVAPGDREADHPAAIDLPSAPVPAWTHSEEAPIPASPMIPDTAQNRHP